MEMGNIKYESEIKRLKKWRNWLLTIITTLVITNITIYYIWHDDYIPSDEEVLQAAIDTNFMGYAYALKLNDSGIDKDIVIEMAREDPKVIAQIERNRNK